MQAEIYKFVLIKNSIMKKIILFSALMLITNSFSQETSLFKGLNLGMSKKEAKAEYKANKSQYDNIDIGNGSPLFDLTCTNLEQAGSFLAREDVTFVDLSENE